MKRLALLACALLASAPAAAQQLSASELQSYRARIERLEDEDAIENLQATWGYYFDKGLWDEASALFAASGTFEYGQRGVYRGRAHIRRAFELFGPQGLGEGRLNNHMQLQPVITVAPDGKTATARWQGMVMLAEPGANGKWGVGVYENAYLKERGTWKIARLHYYQTALTDYDAGFAKSALPMDEPSAQVPPDQPPSETYRAFPSAYVPPFSFTHPVTGAALGAAANDPPAVQPSVSGTTKDSLGQRITRLEDLNAIERLQKVYGYFVDKGQWTRLSELFADDATLEIGGRGIFVGRNRVLEYMHGAFGPDGPKEGVLAQHMQFQPIADVSPDGKTGWVRSRAFVMSNAGWGLPMYENEYRKGADGIWRISRLTGPFTMYTNWEGWGKNALNNTWPDKFDPPPDLPPSNVYLTYPAYWIVPFHYPNPVTGKPFVPEPVGAYHRAPGTAEQEASRKVGQMATGSQPIAEPR